MKKALFTLLSVLLFCVASCTNLINKNNDNFSFTLGEENARVIKSSISPIINENDNVTVSCVITNFENTTSTVTVPLKDLDNAKISFSAVPYNKKLNLIVSVSYNNTDLYYGELSDLFTEYYNESCNIILTPSTYSITYEANGGTLPSKFATTYSFSKGEVILPIPTKEGYTFVGWCDNKECKGNTIKSITKYDYGNKEYYASWKAEEVKPNPPLPGNKHTITYKTSKGTITENSKIVDDNTLLTKNYLPTLNNVTGYNFLGWTLEGSLVTEDTVTVTKDITLEAKWEAISYTITYDLGYESKTETATYTIENLPYDLKTVKRTGYGFDGWTIKDDTSGTFITKITDISTGNITYVANWTQASYNVTYESAHGTAPNKVKINNGKLSPEQLPDLQETGYNFLGWFINDTKITTDYPITEDIVLVARWEAISYTVTYDLGYESKTETATYTIEDLPYTLKTITRPGYGLAGWTDKQGASGTLVTQITDISTGNKTYYAKWTQGQYTIKYVSEHGTPPDTFNGKITKLLLSETIPNLVAEGYTFLGWYNNDVKVNHEDSINTDLTLVAKWEVLNTRTFLWETGGRMYLTRDLENPTPIFEREKGNYEVRDFAFDALGNSCIATSIGLVVNDGDSYFRSYNTLTNLQLDPTKGIVYSGIRSKAGKRLDEIRANIDKVNGLRPELEDEQYTSGGGSPSHKGVGENFFVYKGYLYIVSIRTGQWIDLQKCKVALRDTNTGTTRYGYRKIEERKIDHTSMILPEEKRLRFACTSMYIYKDYIYMTLCEDSDTTGFYRVNSRGMIIGVPLDLTSTEVKYFGWTNVPDTSTVMNAYTPKDIMTKEAFFGPKNIIQYSADSIKIADEGIRFIQNPDDTNSPFYENVDRVVTFDLNQFKITNVEILNKCEPIPEKGESGYFYEHFTSDITDGTHTCKYKTQP